MSREFVILNEWVTLVRMDTPNDAKPYFYFQSDDYVSIIALNERNEVALVRQFRPTLNIETLELPGGIIEHGQSVFDAATKELLEETGLGFISYVAEIKPLYVDSVRLSLRNHTVILRTSSEKLAPSEPEIQLTWVHRDDLLKLLENGQISLESHSGAIAKALLLQYI